MSLDILDGRQWSLPSSARDKLPEIEVNDSYLTLTCGGREMTGLERLFVCGIKAENRLMPSISALITGSSQPVFALSPPVRAIRLAWRHFCHKRGFF
jgi:hypothetical protein